MSVDIEANGGRGVRDEYGVADNDGGNGSDDTTALPSYGYRHTFNVRSALPAVHLRSALR